MPAPLDDGMSFFRECLKEKVIVVPGVFFDVNPWRLSYTSEQVFVANPKKPPQIETILRRNKEKLLVFLKGFHNDKEGACIYYMMHW